MNDFKRISCDQLQQLLAAGPVTLADVRDPQSYQQGHLDNAALLDNNNLGQFIADSDQQQPLVVYCYHGNSSQGAAQYLFEQGFTQAYSLDGGFEAWRQHKPFIGDS